MGVHRASVRRQDGKACERMTSLASLKVWGDYDDMVDCKPGFDRAGTELLAGGSDAQPSPRRSFLRAMR